MFRQKSDLTTASSAGPDAVDQNFTWSVDWMIRRAKIFGGCAGQLAPG
ncbi:hypothetical protein [Solimonas sp. SE-A11]|nr:hypothetical protein [Solimonas sp. SE-A11]MDM4772587.1 hypothetical protein [Solimonas sp. SE-A11]